MELRLLGPLLVLVGGEEVPLGGAKQRTVFATLLLRAGDVVPVERLIDELWGDDPPQSAAHSLESYVSRLRQVLNGHGPVLVRRGSGYSLELGDATLDADAFEELASMAGEAADVGDHRRTFELVREALSHWRGPVLGDVALGPTGRAGAERLEELRLHALEQRFDAELALGRDKELVGELQALVGQNPYREQFVGQLMLALYRAGRQAEALDVYEETRRRLDSDLGLQPSAELRVLSAQIVRQEPQLRRPSRQVRAEIDGPLSVGRSTRRLSRLVAAGLSVAAVMALTASGGAALPASSGVVPERVALIQAAASDTVHKDRVSEPFRTLAAAYGYQPETLELDQSEGSRAVAAERLRQRIERGGFALVITTDDTTAGAVSPLVAERPDRTFVFLDTSLQDFGLAGAPNASAIRFRDEQSSQLAGYLSALIRPRLAGPDARVDSVVVVAGPRTPHVQRVVRGYIRGVRHAKRPIRVRVVHSEGTEDVTECERIANAQIDAGADVVFAAAGRCGLGAIAVARVRGVWAIGAEEDGADPRGGELGVTTKNWVRAIQRAISNYDLQLLPLGRDDAFGLEDEYAVMIETGVPESVFSKIVTLCSKIRQAVTTGA